MVRPGAIASSALAALALTVTAAGTAAASPYVLGPDLKVSGASSLTACPFGASDDFAAAYDNTEVEPQVAVDPTNPNEITGVSPAGPLARGGARGLSSWMSGNGGASWAQLPDVPWSACQDGPTRFGRVTDPWVSYDKAGNLYFIGQPIDSAALGISAISATTWNGSSWRAPTILIEDEGSRGISNDKVSITGDPTRAGYAYATWLRFTHPAEGENSPVADLHSFAFRGQPMISRTTDAGPDVVARGADARVQHLSPGQPDRGRARRGALRRRGEPVHGRRLQLQRRLHVGDALPRRRPPLVGAGKIAPISFVQLFVPDDDTPIRAEDYLPDIAIDPDNGDIYVVWSDGRGTPFTKVVMAKSSDGGRHWSARRGVDGRPDRAVLQPLDRRHGTAPSC